MTAPIDIFHMETRGSVLWLESAATIEDAKSRIRKLADGPQGEYLLLNRRTGLKILVTTEDLDSSLPVGS